ncbi:MAG: PaaI family thioesterase [Maricaulaceae bacterium]
MNTPKVQISDYVTTELARIPYAKVLGMKPLFMGEEFTLCLPYAETLVGNPTLPALHGGVIGGFMELAAITQLLLSMKPETGMPLPKPIGINIDYLRRGRPQDTFARAVVFKQGSRVANVRVQAWQDSYDNPIAALHGHFLTAAPKKE